MANGKARIIEATYPPVPNGTQPPHDVPAYRSTALRHPKLPLIRLSPTLLERSGPCYTPRLGRIESDLTRQHSGEPLGERILVEGRVLDDSGRPLRGTWIELWQANAAGRYAHKQDGHDAPLDPNFSGSGRALTDDDGCYRFVTIKPGAYPWRNHFNAWRPAHLHFSLFGGSAVSRLITQMYFPGDPLLEHDPIFHAVPDSQARARLVASLDWTRTQPEWALAYRFDIVLRGPRATPLEAE